MGRKRRHPPLHDSPPDRPQALHSPPAAFGATGSHPSAPGPPQLPTFGRGAEWTTFRRDSFQGSAHGPVPGVPLQRQQQLLMGEGPFPRHRMVSPPPLRFLRPAPPPVGGQFLAGQDSGAMMQRFGSPPGLVYRDRYINADDRPLYHTSRTPPAAVLNSTIPFAQESFVEGMNRPTEMPSSECTSRGREANKLQESVESLRKTLPSKGDEVLVSGKHMSERLNVRQRELGIAAGNQSSRIPPAAAASGVISVPTATEGVEKISANLENMATMAYEKVLAAGKGVTLWKVIQEMLLALKAPSLESVGVRCNDIPCLRKLSFLEGKVNAFIHCHVAVKRITTLHDLSIQICQHEGVKDFNELGLGPLVCQPLVLHYFAPPVPSDVSEITADEVVQHLSDYLNKHQSQTVQVEDFLSYMTTKRSLPSPQHLCVRIQSLGMHVSFLRREKRAEKALASRQASFARVRELAAKDQVEEPHIIRRVDSFLESSKHEAAAQHIRYVYLESDDEGNENDKDVNRVFELNDVGANKKSRNEGLGHLSSTGCPYPSATEERARLFQQIPPHLNHILSKKGVAMSKKELEDFIAAWKGVCCKHSIFEVLTRMLDVYLSDKTKKAEKQKRKFARMFKIYPAIGLLNVAVVSMKAGHWDSMYDAFQEALVENLHHQNETDIDEASKLIEVCSGATSQSTSCAQVKAPSASQVLERVVRAIGDNVKKNDGGVCSITQYAQGEEKCIATLKRILRCEKLLAEQFCVSEFSCLGFGEFPEFLEHHWAQLSESIIGNFMGARKINQNELVPEHRVHNFISQVAIAVGDVNQLSEEYLLQVLRRQFGLQCADDYRCGFLERFVNPLKEEDRIRTCKGSIYFSAALLATKISERHSSIKASFPYAEEKNTEVMAGHKVGLLGSMGSSDALRCLQQAPMLYNLSYWSHWDCVFSPTMGSLIDWLEKEGSGGGLDCIITSDGAAFRIDGSATVDDFLVAALMGSGRHAAVILVSLVVIYGGVAHIPQALLKSHTSKALEILIKNASDSSMNIPLNVGRLKRKQIELFEYDEVAKKIRHYSPSITTSQSDFSIFVSQKNITENKSLSEHAKFNKAIDFIIDCLFHVPLDFRSFAAFVLVPPFLAIVPSAPVALLNNCLNTEQRAMLHGIGIALGITEWIDDYRSLFSLPSSYPSSQSKESLQLITEDKNVPAMSRTSTLSGKKTDAMEVCGSNQLQSSNIKELDALTEEPMESHGVLKVNSILKDSGTSQDSDCTDSKEDRSERMSQMKLEEEARNLIEMIRREEFGLDLKLKSKEKRLLAKQHARTGRALQCLSRELYSQDLHFVLELVQNADDNQYEPGVEAVLVFIVQSKRILILNNEQGFTAANMKALCDIGNSTKVGTAAGYIGHKGIGFKSVFRVTDAPEIHSNGFHVKFDVSEGNLGFILPSRIPPVADTHTFEEVSLAIEKVTRYERLKWNTCMVLPLKSSVLEGHAFDSLVSKFGDLHPSLLLFLHRIRCITIRNDVTRSTCIIQRQELAHGLVRVVHGELTAVWMVVKKRLEAAVARPGVQTTEIALAFPLQELSDGGYEPCCERQKVFAFLPLRSYGLKFILQGDFILPSSREEVDSDSAWNQWLLSEIPDVCTQAVDSLKRISYFQQNPGKAASVFMSFMPLEGEVQGFFSSLPRMVLSALRTSPCLPVEDSSGDWTFPCMLLGGWDNFSRRLMPDALLKEHLGLGYLHRDVVINPLLASSLGLHMYGTGTLVGLMESLCNKKGALGGLGPQWIGSWLISLSKCLMSESQKSYLFLHQKMEDDLFRDLRCLPFIPLSDGTFTCINDAPVWLPCGVSGIGNEASAFMLNFPLLNSELRTIHPLLLHPSCVEEECLIPKRGESRATSQAEVGSLLYIMLQRVGVGQVLAHEVINTHIMPNIVSDECMKKQERLVIEYLAFIVMHLQLDCMQCRTDRSKIILQLQERAIILTNNGYKRLRDEHLHFNVEFGCPVEAKGIIHGTQLVWNEVDAAYLQLLHGQTQVMNPSKWRIFLKELGVTDFVKLVKVQKRVFDKSDSIWKASLWDEHDGRDGWIVTDWECPELVQILKPLSSPDIEMPKRLDKCANLLSALDLLWDDYYLGCIATYKGVGSISKVEKQTEPSFILQMRCFQWVQSSFDGQLRCPTKLFHQCYDVESILGNNAPYATPQVKSKGLVAALGLRTKVLVNDVLELLKLWSLHPFKANVSQMTRLYNFLWSSTETQKDDILHFVRSEPCIFLPVTSNVNSEKNLPGKFFSVQEVCWSDKSGLLDLLLKSNAVYDQASSKSSLLRELCRVYPNMYNFFVGDCQVQETMNFKEYVDLLKTLSAFYSPGKIRHQVMSVLVKWSQDIELGQAKHTDVSQLKELLQDVNNQVLPTVQGRWVSLHHSVGLICWCDNKDLGEQFMNSGRVFYIETDTNTAVEDSQGTSTGILPFLQAMNIRCLSEVVQREPIVYGTQGSRWVLDLLKWVLPYIQRYVQKWHPDHYKLMQQSSFNERIKHLRCFTVDELYFRYTLPGGVVSGSQRISCDYLLEGDTFYATQANNLNSLFFEFSRLFFNGKPNLQLANFLHLITLSAQSGVQESEVESSILGSQGIARLYEGEPLWTIEFTDTEEMKETVSQKSFEQKKKLRDITLIKHTNKSMSNEWPPRSWQPALERTVCGISQIMTASHKKSLNFSSEAEVKRNSRIQQIDENTQYSVMQGEGNINELENSRNDLVPVAAEFENTTNNILSGQMSNNLNLQKILHASDNRLEVFASQMDHKAESFSHAAQLVESSSLPSSQVEVLKDTVYLGTEKSLGDHVSFREREKLLLGQPNDQQQELTGRLGEALVFKYLVKKHGADQVRWLNKDVETGAAYDIVLDEGDGEQKFIEVKATRSGEKDWFEITQREWELAVQVGERFIIIRVLFSGSSSPMRLLWLPNPVKLCRERIIKLAVLLPQQHLSLLCEDNLNVANLEDDQN